jgi:hypothetical protein
MLEIEAVLMFDGIDTAYEIEETVTVSGKSTLKTFEGAFPPIRGYIPAGYMPAGYIPDGYIPPIKTAIIVPH